MSKIKQDVLNAIRDGLPELIVFDFETSGLNPEGVTKDGEPVTPDVPIQLSAQKYRFELNDNKVKLELVEEFDKYFKIGRKLNPVVVELTGITDEKLETEGLPEEEVFKFWQKFVGMTETYCGYNSSFDIRFGRKMAERYGEDFEPIFHLDVLKMARDRVPKADTPSHKLGDISKLYGIEAKFHDSMEDVRATAKLLEIFINEYLEEGETVSSLSLLEQAMLLKPNFVGISYWGGFRGMSRTYFKTTEGDFYVDNGKVGEMKKQKRTDDERDVDVYDMDFIVSVVRNTLVTVGKKLSELISANGSEIDKMYYYAHDKAGNKDIERMFGKKTRDEFVEEAKKSAFHLSSIDEDENKIFFLSERDVYFASVVMRHYI